VALLLVLEALQLQVRHLLDPFRHRRRTRAQAGSQVRIAAAASCGRYHRSTISAVVSTWCSQVAQLRSPADPGPAPVGVDQVAFHGPGADGGVPVSPGAG
jgi:hypothetical protein